MSTARPALAVALAAALSACPEGSTIDAGVRGEDTGVSDATPRDGRPRADGGDAGVRDRSVDEDAEPTDLGLDDGGFLPPDGGAAAAGASCETAEPWPDLGLTPIIADTGTAAQGRERFTCGAPGSGGGPEAWWSLDLPQPAHVTLRLGTEGWDAVLAARTGTCARSAESCADAPTLIELPQHLGPLFVGADGFATGRGPYVLSAELGPALEVPPANASCALAERLDPPAQATGHGFGASESPAACAMREAVFYRVELAATATLTARAAPLGAQDLELALLAADCTTVLECQASLGRQSAETVVVPALAAGSYFLAVGSRADRMLTGSFTVAARAGAACKSDLDCPWGQGCGGDLSCAAQRSQVALGPWPIPDGSGRLEVPLVVLGAGPIGRVSVRVEVEHAFPEDLVVELVSQPAPRPVVVRLRSRSTGPRGVVYGRDRPAEGPGSLDDLRILASGSGTWLLRVEDRSAGDDGTLLGVELSVEDR